MDSLIRKRTSDDSSESDSVRVKRLREDLLVDTDSDDSDPTVDNLASVMKSFEEEISGGFSSVLDPTSDSGESRPELGYLLEASDDELGLPPSSNGVGEKTEETEIVEPVLTESDGLVDGVLWEFEDEMPSFDSVEFGDNGSYNGDYLAFDDGLFDYSDVYESSDLSWRSETMPAI